MPVYKVVSGKWHGADTRAMVVVVFGGGFKKYLPTAWCCLGTPLCIISIAANPALMVHVSASLGGATLLGLSDAYNPRRHFTSRYEGEAPTAYQIHTTSLR